MNRLYMAFINSAQKVNFTCNDKTSIQDLLENLE